MEEMMAKGKKVTSHAGEKGALDWLGKPFPDRVT